MHRRLPTMLVLGLLALAAIPAGASASSGSDQIINECANETLSRQFTQKEYEQALANLPADLREYTDCDDVIRTAMRAAATSSGGGTGRDGSGTRAVTGGGGGTGTTGGPTAAAPGQAGTTGTPAATSAAATTGTTGAAPAPSAPAATPAPAATDPNAAAADQAALQAAQKQGANAVQIGGTTLNPGDPAGVALSLGDLPTPMLVLLGLLGLVALCGVAALLKGWVLGIGRSRGTPDPR